MGPKKKAGKDKAGDNKTEVPELTEVERTFYELTINDLNNKLTRLRAHVSSMEGGADDMTEKMRLLVEDRTDLTANQDRILAEHTDIIREMNERLDELDKVRQEKNQQSHNKIQEWETRYKAMLEQLTCEIKLLNGKLTSLESFRAERSELLMKYDEQEAQMKERRRLQEEKIQEMQEQSIIEKDQIKKDVEVKLLQQLNLTKSNENRIAEYTQRLIRENIALNKEMDLMIQTQIRMNQDNRNMKKRATDIEQSYRDSEKVKQCMVKKCQDQIQIIEKLTDEYEYLQSKLHKIMHYKKLYEASLKRDICERFSYNEMNKKLRIFTQRVEMLKADKQKLISFHQKHEDEIRRLSDIIKKIKYTLQSAIRGETCTEDHPEFRAAQRKTLLSDLMEILSTYDEQVASTPSRSTISSDKVRLVPSVGLMPKKAASLLELFKREAKKISSAELISPAFKPKILDGRITPKPRFAGEDTIIDVQSGTTLEFSTGAPEEEAPPEEGLEDDQEDYGESSSAESVAKSPSKTEQPAEKPPEEKKDIPVEIKKSTFTLRSGYEEEVGEEEMLSYTDALIEAEEEEEEAAYFLY